MRRRARLAVAEGRVNEAIQILRDLADPDSRSVLFSILGTSGSTRWWRPVCPDLFRGPDELN